MKKAVAVINRIFSVILVAALLFAGYVFITVMRTRKNEVPSVFGFSFMQVATGSMEPTIPTGSLIIVRKTDAAQIKVGDVICFYSTDPTIAGMPNTHRVTQIMQENGTTFFVTKGDAGTKVDPYPVYPDQLIGKYLRYVSVGNMPDIIHSKYFFFFALLVPLCIVAFYELMHVRKLADERAEEQKKKEETHEKEP